MSKTSSLSFSHFRLLCFIFLAFTEYVLPTFAGRQTTREEDIAYSLLGLFDVNMPLLYGEGSVKAFLRLQEEIMKLTEDQSIFAWVSDEKHGYVERVWPFSEVLQGNATSEWRLESFRLTWH